MNDVLSLLFFSGVFLMEYDAFSYGEFFHKYITGEIIKNNKNLREKVIEVPPKECVEKFRVWFYNETKGIKDRKLRERFLNRYPDEKNFTSISMREFLSFSMDQKKKIRGFDTTHKEGKIKLIDLMVDSCTDPDDDQRNMDRFSYKENGSLVLDKYNKKVPKDPAILNMGEIEGLSSQAHAHYGIIEEGQSSSIITFFEETQKFAIPLIDDEKVRTFGDEMAQLHTDLALLSKIWGGEGWEYLYFLFISHAFHYIQDISNPPHSVQIGGVKIIIDAIKTYSKRALLSFGGFFAPLMPFTNIAIKIIKNHHLLSESFLDKIVMEDKLNALLVFQKDDEDLKKLFKKKLGSHSSLFAKVLSNSLTELTCNDGVQVYSIINEISLPKIKEYGFELEDGRFDPYEYIDFGKKEKISEFIKINEKVFTRIATAMRIYIESIENLKIKKDDLIENFLRRRINHLDDEDRRREKYLLNPLPPLSATNKNVPWLIIQFGLIGGLFFGIYKIFKKKPSTQHTTAKF